MIAIRPYGWYRDRAQVLWIPRLSMIIGYHRIGCPECDGSGWWGYGPTENECGPCVQCKGTGKIMVSC